MTPSAANNFSETDHQAQLTSALADARMLLAFAAQNNRGLDVKLVEGITTASTELETHLQQVPPVLDAKVVSAFWSAYDVLAVALAPVSADSIRQTQAALASRDTRGVLGIMATAFLGLVVVVALQAYVLGGTELLRQIKDAEAEQVKLQAPLTTLALSLKDAKQRSEVLGAVSANRLSKAEAAQATEKSAAIRKEVESLEMQWTQQDREQTHYHQKETDAQWLLYRWYGPLRWLFGLVEIDAQEKPPTQCTAAVKTPDPCDPDRADRAGGKLRAMATLILVPLSLYVGPAVLGILGAATYVLRNTSDRLANYSYVRLTRGFGTARIVLGAVGGMIGSVLLSGGISGDAVLKTLPALGLPFLMGYAVEVFFVFLDKIVSTFTSTATPSSKAGG